MPSLQIKNGENKQVEVTWQSFIGLLKCDCYVWYSLAEYVSWKSFIAVHEDSENANGMNLEYAKRVEIVSPRREKTDMDMGAQMLIIAVVMYCGSPVGNVAANDPG